MFEIKIDNQIYNSKKKEKITESVPGSKITRSCEIGVCRVCKCKLIKGKIKEGEKNINNGEEFLACMSTPESNVEIESIIKKTRTGTISSKEIMDKNKIIKIKIKIKKTYYNTGDLILIEKTDNKRTRPYSIVNIDEKNYEEIEIHIKKIKNGEISNYLNEIKLGEKIQYEIINKNQITTYQEIKKIIVVSGGSGMGVALSKAIEISKKIEIEEFQIFAINRDQLSDYHKDCIKRFKERITKKSKVIVKNIRFTDWIKQEKEISEKKDEELTIGVGSKNIVKKIMGQKNTDIEYFN